MKKLIPYLLCCCILISCKHSTSTDALTPDNVIKGYCWVTEKYVNEIRSGEKTVRDAEDDATFLAYIGKLGDTVNIGYIHQGGDYHLIRKDSSGYKIISTWNSKTMQLKIISKEEIELDGQKMCKVPGGSVKGDYLLEGILLAGKYKMQDGREVELTLDGKVRGLDTVKYYSGLVDYIDEGMNLDMVTLGREEKNQNDYGFQYHKDTLVIYALNCAEYDTINKECAVLKLGKQLYKMWKVK